MNTQEEWIQKPPWLKVRLSANNLFASVSNSLASQGLYTVCEEARCPNKMECWSRGTSTFMILGDRCTRDCRFCAVATGPDGPPDAEEPQHVAAAVREMNLDFVVITSVTRDDLPDGGAAHFVSTIEAIRLQKPSCRVEVLTPDFGGSSSAVITLAAVKPEVIGHNMETAPRLYPSVRPGADYRRSLALFHHAREAAPDIPLKSGLMLGLGESPDEVRRVMEDLVAAGVRLLTLGQYLQPSKSHLPVKRYVTPDDFTEWRRVALAMGFAGVAAGPLVRSSYLAADLYREAINRHDTSKHLPGGRSGLPGVPGNLGSPEGASCSAR
ncbi:MAG: lipoyl synthase [Nitrospirae bacterium]|nr:lipoyl synthase [Nitrospirota bacterium]